MIMKCLPAIAFCILLSSCSSWRYQQTQDKTAILGRSSSALSITVGNVTANFRIPKGYQVKSCVDQPLDWHYVVFSEKQNLGFYVTLDKGFQETPLIDRYQSYLNGIHDVHDPNVKMSPASQVYLKDGSAITPYLYYSPYWQHRLVVMIPHGVYTTTFEFSAPTLTELEAQDSTIQSILRSFSYKVEQGAAANP